MYQYNQWYCNSCRRYPYLHQQARPHQPIRDPQPNQCPICVRDLRFIHQYNKYWCDHCRSYLAPRSKKPRQSYSSRSVDDDDDLDHDWTPTFDVGISSGRRKTKGRKKRGYHYRFAHDRHEDEDRKEELPDTFHSSSSSDSFRRSGDRVYASRSRIGSMSKDEEYRIRGDRLISTSDGSAKYRIRDNRLYEI